MFQSQLDLGDRSVIMAPKNNLINFALIRVGTRTQFNFESILFHCFSPEDMVFFTFSSHL